MNKNDTETKRFLLKEHIKRLRSLGPEHLDTLRSLRDLGDFYAARGQREQAEAIYHQALSSSAVILPPGHPLIAAISSRLIELYMDWLKSAEREGSSQGDHLLRKQMHLDSARTLHKLASIFLRQAKWEQAEVSLQRILPLYEKAGESAYQDLALCLEQLAYLYTRQEQFQEAETSLRRAREVREEVVGPEHPDIATNLVVLAGVYTVQGQFEQAEQVLRQALVLFMDTSGSDDPIVAVCRSHLATLALREGKPEQAARFFQQVLSMWERVSENV